MNEYVTHTAIKIIRLLSFRGILDRRRFCYVSMQMLIEICGQTLK